MDKAEPTIAMTVMTSYTTLCFTMALVKHKPMGDVTETMSMFYTICDDLDIFFHSQYRETQGNPGCSSFTIVVSIHYFVLTRNTVDYFTILYHPFSAKDGALLQKRDGKKGMVENNSMS